MPPLVLLMGLAMPALAWSEDLIRYFVRRGLYVIAVENRDVGLSERIPACVSNYELLKAGVRALLGKSVEAPYSVEDMSEDVEALMDELHIVRAHIAGVSMGGMIAQAFACRSPHRVITMTCISTTTGNPWMMLCTVGGVIGILKSALAKRGSKDDEVKRMRALAHAIGTPGAERSDVEIASLMAMCSATGITQETFKHHLMAVFAGTDRRRRLQQLNVPTLVIHGTRDRLLPIRAGKEIAACVRNAEFLPIVGMGHDMPAKYITVLGEAIANHCYAHYVR